MRKSILSFILISQSCITMAQNVGIGTNTPNTTAILDLVSSVKGFRLPQVSIDSLKDILSISSSAKAQDVQPYFPELMYQRYNREITKPVLALDYSGFGIIAIKAIQEQ